MDVLSLIPKLYFPQRVFFGSQSLRFLKTLDNNEMVFLVSKGWNDQNKLQASELLSDRKVFFHTGEPLKKDVDELITKIKINKFDHLITLGGGSVIDTGKIIKKTLNCRHISIPTTIGSGAETSQFAVLIDESDKVVYGGPDLLPDVVLLNPHFLTNLSRSEIVYQTFDALSHCLESLASRASNTMADILALSALEIIVKVLEETGNSFSNQELELLQAASFYAGCAQSSAATGLIHSFAHYFGPRLKKTHNRLVTTFLIPVLELNLQHSNKYEKLRQSKDLSEKNIVKRIKQLTTKFSLKSEKISLVESKEKTVQSIKKNICTVTNPYNPTERDIAQVLDVIGV